MAIEHKTDGETVTISILEPRLLELSVAEGVSHDVLAVLEKTREPNVVLDLSRVELISGTGYAALLRINKMCRDSKINLRLRNVTDGLQAAMKTIGLLGKVFTLEEKAAAGEAPEAQ